MDASHYKDYVLVLLFVKCVSGKCVSGKCVSDKYSGQKDVLLDMPAGASPDTVALKGDKELGDKINKEIAKPAESPA